MTSVYVCINDRQTTDLASWKISNGQPQTENNARRVIRLVLIFLVVVIIITYVLGLWVEPGSNDACGLM